MLRKALEFRDDMAGKGFIPSCITFLSLLYGICVEGRSKEWMDLIDPDFDKVEIKMVCNYKMLFDWYVCV